MQNILKLFALFPIIACLLCQTTYLILSCVYVQAEVCTCYVESVVGLSPLWRLRWQSPNDKAKELPWKCCYYYLWSAGVSTFSYYQAISHRLALQWILFRIIICFTDTGQRYAFFFPLWLSLQTLAGPMSFANFRCDLQLFPDSKSLELNTAKGVENT